MTKPDDGLHPEGLFQVLNQVLLTNNLNQLVQVYFWLNLNLINPCTIHEKKFQPTLLWVGCVCFFSWVFKQTFIFPPQKSCELLVTWGSIGCLGETSERGEVEEKGDTQDTICRETALNFWW